MNNKNILYGAVLAAALSLTSHANAAGFADCPQFFVNGKPPVVKPRPLLRELCYDSFAILHSGETKTPVFVAERLNRAAVADADEKRTNRFFEDARLPSAERAKLDDYKGSGYSRGHMAPAGDMPNVTAMAQSFSLANMVPQDQKHNSGPWAKAESDTRKYAARATGDVYVVTGPVFAPGGETIGAGKVHVPTHIYKLVFDAQKGKGWAHWQENRNGKQDMRPISVDELKLRLVFDFGSLFRNRIQTMLPYENGSFYR